MEIKTIQDVVIALNIRVENNRCASPASNDPNNQAIQLDEYGFKDHKTGEHGNPQKFYEYMSGLRSFNRVESKAESNEKSEWFFNQTDKLYNEGSSPKETQYTQRKKIALSHLEAINSRASGNTIIYPLKDAQGAICGYQRIDNDKKRLAKKPNETISGKFAIIPGSEHKICIAEGLSTASSIAQATGYTCYIALNAGNIVHVAQVVKSLHPQNDIIICADNDFWNVKNDGLDKATRAAKIIGCFLAVPEFKNTDTFPTDFNDLAKLEGLHVVLNSINSAKKIKATKKALREHARMEVAKEYPTHELGTIQLIIDSKQGDNFAYCDELGWLHFNGKYWQKRNADKEIFIVAIDTLEKRYNEYLKIADDEGEKGNPFKPETSKAKNIVYGLQAFLAVDYRQFDNDPDSLNCNNGLVDLRTGKITPHSPEQYNTYCINTDYIKNKPINEWKIFLQQTFVPDDKLELKNFDEGEIINGVAMLTERAVPPKKYIDLLDYIQISLGHSITGRVEDSLWYVQGEGRSGKGTLFQTLQYLLGDLAASVGFETFTGKRDAGGQNFDLAPLRNKRIVFASENANRQRINEAVIKRLTGNDPIYCAYKHKEHFNFTPKFKIWLASNYDIKADGGDNALWRRLKLLSTPNSRIGKEDTGLRDRLQSKEMLEQALCYLVQGAKYWYGLFDEGQPMEEPSIVTGKKMLTQQENDNIGIFISDTFVEDKNGFIATKLIYESYREWCDSNGLKPLAKNNLTKELKERNLKPKRTRASRGFEGISYINSEV